MKYVRLQLLALLVIVMAGTVRSTAHQGGTSLTLGLPGYWGHLTYTITGADFEAPTGSDRGNVGGRNYVGQLTGTTLTIDGAAISDNVSSGPGSGDYYELVVTATVGKETRTVSYIAPNGEKLMRPFLLSVPIDPSATSGSFKISLLEQNRNYGPHGWVVTGDLSRRAITKAAPPPPPPPPPVDTRPKVKSAARFSGMHGQVEILRAGEDHETGWRSAQLDTIINVEDHIRTDEDATCILSFADMSTFVLKGESEIVVVTPPDRDSKIGLVLGNIWVNVKKVMKDGTMEIDLNQAVTSIKGTTFVLTATPTISAVDVIEGVVSFTSKVSGDTVMVGAGESAMAGAAGLSPIFTMDMAALSAEWEAVRRTAAPRTAVAPAADAACGEGVTLFSNSNGSGVGNGPTAATRFTLDAPALISSILTYHWNDGRGEAPGTIALQHADGTRHGPWPALGEGGQGNARNVNWVARPQVTLKAGTYTVIDSHPASWAQNAQSAGHGMTVVKGCFVEEAR